MEIEFRDVTLLINKSTPFKQTMIEDMSFRLLKGKIYGFLGNSESSKSYIGKLLSLVVAPTTGSILIDGKTVTNKNFKEFKKSIGYVLKNSNEIFLCDTVKEELTFGVRQYGYNVNTAMKKIGEILRLLGLDISYLEKNISELNHAEKKKISLASILLYDPKIIILDEISMFFNEREKKDLIRLLRILKNRYGKTIIIITGDTDFLYKISNYNYIVSGNKIITQGEEELLINKKILDKENLYYPKALEFVRIANENKNAKLEYYKDVKELIKGVYRSVF